MKKLMPVLTSLLFLLIPIFYVITSLLQGHLLNEFMIQSSIVVFVITFIFAIIKKIPWKIRTIVLIVILPIICFCYLWLNGVGGHDEFKVYENEQVLNENNIDFDKEEYGDFENITYYDYLSTGIFQQESFTWILKYDGKNFEKETERINSEYTFYTEPVQEEDDSPEFSIDGFNFRLRTDSSYPKEMDFIGINKESREIVYLSFYDYELDGVWDFEDLLESFGGWYHIRRARNGELAVFG